MRRREFLMGAPAAALAKTGKGPVSILVPEDVIPSERRAAAELQSFLERMSGAKLPLVAEGGSREGGAIVLRHTDEFGPEGFALRTDGRDTVISGGRPRGVMYGAYALLEKLGCRWFTPEVSRVPRRSLAMPRLDEVQKPAFEYREVYFTEACDRDWAARNKTNGNLSLLDGSTGGKVQYFPFVHTFAALVPPKQYFASHPEYYSLLGGRRTADNSQLCLSNPEVQAIARETVLGWIGAHPEATIFSVSQNDNERYCECDACRRIEAEEGGAHSGPLLQFVNGIAAEVAKRYPDKLIDTLAYQYTEDPPEKARPLPNVRIRLCPIGACQAHPYEQCPQNASVVRNLNAWARITNQLYIWHYVTNFANYILPFPDFDEIAADIPMYQRNGVVGLFLEGAYPKGGGAENSELRSYVSARLMWDTKADVELAIREFLEGVYGPRAARPLRAWFDMLHREVRTPPRGKGRHIWTYSSPRLTEAEMADARKLFAKAEAAAADDAARKRVRKARLPLDYAGFLRAKTFSLRGASYSPEDLPSLKDKFQTFVSAAREHGVTSIHEGRGLEQDEREFAEMMKAYDAAVIENGARRAAVVPGLGGRIVSLADKATGREYLRRPDPEERNYPDQGGCYFGLYRDSIGGARIWLSWTLAKSGPDEAVLTGRGENGLVVERTFRLAGSELRVESVVRNTGVGRIEFAALERLELHAEDAVLRAGGVETPLAPPAGNATCAAPGEWRVEARGGSALTHRFSGADVDRAAASWRARGEDRVVLSVWWKQQALEPGGSWRSETALS